MNVMDSGTTPKMLRMVKVRPAARPRLPGVHVDVVELADLRGLGAR